MTWVFTSILSGARRSGTERSRSAARRSHDKGRTVPQTGPGLLAAGGAGNSKAAVLRAPAAPSRRGGVARRDRPTGRRSARPGFAAAVLLCASALVLAACATSSTPTPPVVGLKMVTGGTASYAMGPGFDFSWILPLENEANFEPYDFWVENELWRPLYYPGGPGYTGIDYGLSLAHKPVFSNNDSAVTITLRHGYKWSDGSPVTTSDVQFFFQLEAAGAKLGKYANYVPGEMPDDIKSITYNGPYSLTIDLTHSYNPVWFTANQLTWIYALPKQAWDRTCSTCTVGNEAATLAGAKAVFNFLYSHTSQLSTYATNPLWKVIDGPWKLSSFNPVTYDTVLNANPKYTGPDRPHLSTLKIYSFTSGTAELDAIRSGTITFGYLPFSDVAARSTYEAMGYTFKPWYAFYNDAAEFGYTGKWAPLVRQLYIRQALQHLVDQPLYISSAYHGYAVQDYGLSPDTNSPYTSPALKQDPYPYSVSAAEALLTAHGWVKSSGVDVCQRPGTAGNECGAGISKGEALSLLYVYPTGYPSYLAVVEAFATAAKQAGIDITLDGQSTTTMYSDIALCPPGPCNYALAGWYPYFWNYGQTGLVPSGSEQLGKGNYWGGGYYSATGDKLLFAAHTQPGVAPLYADENYFSKQVALLWFPVSAQSLVLVKNNLKGWSALNPYLFPMPSRWYYVK